MTMTLEQLEAKQREIADEIKAYRKAQEKSKRRQVNYGEVYYTLLSGLKVETIEEIHDYTDEKRFVSGNYYRTKEEAERARDIILARQRIIDALCEADPERGVGWIDGDYNYYAFYDSNNDTFSIDWQRRVNSITILYSSRDAWKSVIKSHEADLKLIGGIDD